jgi:uncharacterized alpha-E superfamily protein
VISRVADHCFWFGRYLDRAESTARLLQATRTLVFDADLPVTHCWQPLVIVSGEEKPFVERNGREALGDGELVQEYMTWNEANLVSLASSVRAARHCGRAIRDVLSLDAWEEVNELYLWLGRESTQKLYAEHREEFYRSVRRSTQLILGLVRSTMLHEDPMRFLWLGVMMERVGQTARILDMHHHTMEREAAHEIVGVALWMSLLRACSASEGFVKKNQGRVTAEKMVEFVLFEPSFPRSLLYCLRAAADLLRRIWPADAREQNVEPRVATGGARGSVVPPQVVGRASSARLTALIGWLEAQIDDFDLAHIHMVITRVVDDTARVCSHIAQEIQGPSTEPQAPAEAVAAAGEEAAEDPRTGTIQVQVQG